jgi:hypothetical protein
MYKLLPLINSKEEVFVDAADYPFLSKFRWKVVFNKYTGRSYVELQDRSLHRFVLILDGQFLPVNKGAGGVDHRDRNTFNNQKLNLRACTNSQNQMNRGKYAGKVSPYKGVVKLKRRTINAKAWSPIITINGKFVRLPVCATEIEAAQSYNIAAKCLFKDFAVLNDVPEAAGPLSALVLEYLSGKELVMRV